MSAPAASAQASGAPGLGVLVHGIVEAATRAYPHMVLEEIASDDDFVVPRLATPAFFGSYDWHSAVHCHWALVRSLRPGGLAGDQLDPQSAAAASAVLCEHLTPSHLASERAFFERPGGRANERPYGWAWLVMLHAECTRLAKEGEPGAARWAAATEPLAAVLADRLEAYFSRDLAFPVRSGTHANSAFSLQLLHRGARLLGDDPLAGRVATWATRLFMADRHLRWGAPPSGSDFLDPALCEAALLAEVLDQGQLQAWARAAFDDDPGPAWVPPEFRPDGTDPATVHLEGLLCSRAWCLAELARALGPDDPVGAAASMGLAEHLRAVANVDPLVGFTRAHWLPTFFVYLRTRLEGG